MPINPDAVGSESEPAERSWSSKDCLLYAVGVGAGSLDPAHELEFTTENTTDTPQRVLPTQAVVLGAGGGGAFRKVGTFNPAMLVHGEQEIRLAGELPVEGTLRTTATISNIFDKGKGAVIETTARSVDAATGEELFSTRSSAYIRGEGGFGGDRGPSGPRHAIPDRDPDHSVTYQTRDDQALLYRLSGDRNPLHSDPAFAAMGGFDRPILHGLCSYGFTGRALLHTVCDSDPAAFAGMDARFSSPVMPGDALTVRIWTDDGGAFFQTVGADGTVCIDQGRLTVR